MQVDNPGNHRGSTSLPGELFLRMLKALILPLVVPSLITAVGSLDMSLSGKVGCQLVEQLDDHRALSPGGRAGGGILHGDDGAGRGDRHHPRHHHPPWGRGTGEGGGKYSSDAFANSHSKQARFTPFNTKEEKGAEFI